jgi:outer membrane autotransporter protein
MLFLFCTQLRTLCAAAVRTVVFAGPITVALALLGSPAAMAGTCENDVTLTGRLGTWTGAIGPISSGLAGGLAISGAVSAANMAFLTQSTSFVSAPANPKPGSDGSGIWIRGLGGEMTLNSSTSIGAALTQGSSSSVGGTTCSTQFHQTFGGFQLGFDVAKLNVGGWNLTLGTTAGFLETTGHITGGSGLAYNGAFNSTTQSPFVGMYAAANYGRFFVDGVLRYDSFETSLDSPNANIFDQKLDAHGFTLAASAGYNYAVPNSSWFIEPSAGVIWSREAVSPFNATNSVPTNSPVGNINSVVLREAHTELLVGEGTTQLDAIESVIGRLGVRVGTTLETDKVVYSPFAVASVWTDFAGDQTATYTSCPNCIGVPGKLTARLSTSNIGTFGQYSLGVSGQIKDTGWLGYARVDYRNGSEMYGLSGTAGLRYQFSPTPVLSEMPVKAKAPAPVDRPVDWTGWYAGLIGGATGLGRSSMEFPGWPAADMQPSGWLGGGTLGYNFQKDKWVFGVEGDLAKTNTEGSNQCAPLVQTDSHFLPPFAQTTCHDSLDWIATATVRLGYAWTPRSLVYLKAGGAFADEEASMTCNLGPKNFTSGFARCNNPTGALLGNGTGATLNQASASNIRAGWTAGIGTEFALTDHWSIKGEFDWLDFGTKALTMSDGTAVNSALNIAEGKIGVNYKFRP